MNLLKPFQRAFHVIIFSHFNFNLLQAASYYMLLQLQINTVIRHTSRKHNYAPLNVLLSMIGLPPLLTIMQCLISNSTLSIEFKLQLLSANTYCLSVYLAPQHKNNVFI